jgi:peptidoglycan/xylan/chitin deacetylase (PgdA/CDA1 family)
LSETSRSIDWQRLPRYGAYRALAWGEYYLRFSRLITNASNAVLMYHSVGEPGEHGNVSPGRLRRDLAFLTDAFDVVDLPDVLSSPTSGPKRVAVTFDDGYESFYTRALPIVRELDVPVTVFVPSGFIDGRNARFSYRFVTSPKTTENLNDPEGRRPVRQSPDIMSDGQLAEAAADELVTIGNHTRLHPNLSAIESVDELEREILGAKSDLEDRLRITVDRFCYPYGRCDERTLGIVRRSHDLAVTARSGLLDAEPDPYRLPRIGAHIPEPHLQWELTDVRWELAARSRDEPSSS